MSRGKSVFVAALVAVMLAAIWAGLGLLWRPGFVGLSGIMALLGFIAATRCFLSWLEAKDAPDMKPVEPELAPVVLADPVEPTLEDILEEVGRAHG